MIRGRLTTRRKPATSLVTRVEACIGGLLVFVAAGCGPSPDDPLPSTDDLYVYSLAVAEKARLRAPTEAPLAHVNLGRVHERFGFEDKALAEYDKALALDANLGLAYQRIGFILSQRGKRMSDAIDAYQQALRCNSRSPGVYTRLGLIFLHQDRPEQALEALKEELRLKTASADTHYHLGQAYSKLGKTAESIRALRDALQLDPNLRSAHYALARELRLAGDTDGAESALGRFRALKKAEDEAAALKAKTTDGRAEERRFAAETWLDAGDLYHRAANAPLEEGSTEETETARKRSARLSAESVAALEEALRMDPTYEEGWDTYVRVLRNRRKLDAALEFATQAASGTQADGTWAYRAAVLQKQMAQQGNAPAERYRAAIELFESATQPTPELVAAHYEFAFTVLMQLKSRDPKLVERAVEHARTAVELDSSPLHYDILALAYHRTGRIDLARRALEDGIRNNPGATPLVRRLEMLKKSLGRTP